MQKDFKVYIMNIKKISLLLEKSVKNITKNQKNIAIAFSGGLDSTTLASIAKKFCSVKLITIVSDKNSPDYFYSKKAAKQLGLDIFFVFVKKKDILEVYKKLWNLKNGTLIDMEIMFAVYFISKKAKELGCKKIIFGSGAEELFVGYNKYFVALQEKKDLKKLLDMELKTLPKRDIYRIKKVAKIFNIKAEFPFLNKSFVKEVKKIPIDLHINKELSKPILRKVAEFFNVPSFIILRKKKALQYGSKIHKLFLTLAKEKKIYALPPRPPFVYS